MEREEAIEVIRKNWPDASFAQLRKALETVIPEFNESEDERIRKHIVTFLLEADKMGDAPEEVAKWLAYLEKQKEQKFTEKQDYSNLTDLERAIHRGFLSAGVENVPVTIIEETAQECPAQIKPAEIDEYEIIKKHITEDSLSSEVNKRLKECGWYVTYENPAEWSEEEMKVLDSIIDDYEKAAKSFCGYDGKVMFLKAIRDGEYGLSKQEWSEEDDEAYQIVLNQYAQMHNHRSTSITNEEVGKCYAWLKSLHLHHHCKPSEEQN